MLTDNTGAVTATYTYNPYGKVEATTGNPDAVLTYAGEQTDPETGHIYLRNRYYDPTTAQFLTRDPLVASTWEPYGYTGGNPTNHIDPSGFGICFDPGALWGNPSDSCNTIKEQHPETMQHIVNAAGGALEMNPIYRLVEAGIEAVSDCDIDLASQGVDRSSGWYTAGKWSMTAVDFAIPVGKATSAVRGGRRVKVQVHDAHHHFRRLGGKYPHIQVWTYRKGIRNSASKPVRIPLPRWLK